MRGQAPELLLLGQATADEGFFYLDFEDDGVEEVGAPMKPSSLSPRCA
jgi:hypothetical protein